MKIRLAKHTRALAAALAFCVLSAVPAYAQEDDTVEVPGVPVTLSLPAGSLILTRETPVDDAIFETLNVDGAAILENMNKNDLYLDAVLFKPPLEFTLVRVQLPSNSLIDWENSEDAQLCAFVESIYEQLDNITADDCSVYSSEQGIRFVRANILGSKDGITTHSCQYITIRGADVYYLTGIALYGDTLTSSEYDFVEKVAGGLRFTGPAPLPRTASAGLNGDDPLYKVLVGVLSAACLGLIAWVIRNMRKKSAPCVPAQAMPPAAEPFGATTVGAPPVPTASAGPPGTERSGAAPDAVPVFCPLCGQRLPSGVAFCPGCGTPISCRPYFMHLASAPARPFFTGRAGALLLYLSGPAAWASAPCGRRPPPFCPTPRCRRCADTLLPRRRRPSRAASAHGLLPKYAHRPRRL